MTEHESEGGSYGWYAENLFGLSRKEIMGKNVVGTIVSATESSGRDMKELIGASAPRLTAINCVRTRTSPGVGAGVAPLDEPHDP